jgi:hypothetical protein
MTLSITYLNVDCHYAECRYAECYYAESRYDECHYAECYDAAKVPRQYAERQSAK